MSGTRGLKLRDTTLFHRCLAASASWSTWSRRSASAILRPCNGGLPGLTTGIICVRETGSEATFGPIRGAGSHHIRLSVTPPADLLFLFSAFVRAIELSTFCIPQLPTAVKRRSPNRGLTVGPAMEYITPACARDYRGVAQLGSAPEWGSGGRRFKSCLPDQTSRKRRLRARKRVGAVSFLCGLLLQYRATEAAKGRTRSQFSGSGSRRRSRPNASPSHP